MSTTGDIVGEEWEFFAQKEVKVSGVCYTVGVTEAWKLKQILVFKRFLLFKKFVVTQVI